MDKANCSKINPRKIAYEIIYKVAEEGDFIDRASTELCDGVDSRDRAFILRAARGTIERMIELDALIDHYAKTPVKKQKKQIRIILRLAVYQIVYMDSVPSSAAVNEAVKLTRAVRLSQLSGFVNGTLRAVCREIESGDDAAEQMHRRYDALLDNLCADKTRSQALSIRYSMPIEIVDMWLESYGEEQTEKILAAFLSEHPLTLRVHEGRIGADELAKRLAEKLDSQDSYAGPAQSNPSEATETDRSKYQADLFKDLPIIRIIPTVNPEILPGYNEGWFYVQNPSAMAPVDHAMIKLGDKILDVCAAPGGKSIQAAILAGEDGRVRACDLNPARADVIRENIARMKMENIEVQVRDAAVDVPDDHEAYDVVLADLPCSGLGVLSRKPESKYRFNTDEITELTALNTRILDTVSAYVRSGGTLVYSTCTINKAENEDMAEKFLTRHTDYKLIEQEQILPTADGADGFYYAVLRKS